MEKTTKEKTTGHQLTWMKSKAFIENCCKHYAMSAYVTIDEQLIPFRWRCGFRQYMPKKPDKYGMKLFLMFVLRVILSMACPTQDAKMIQEELGW